MTKMTSSITKLVLAALIIGIGLAAFPTSASASEVFNHPAPPERPVLGDNALEKIWAHELAIYARQGKLLERGDTLLTRVQKLIDRASEAGMDVIAAQAALEAFEDALRAAHAAHQRLNGTINSHQGFNAEGKLVDRAKAIETIKEMGQGLREFRSITKAPAKELRKAIRTLREAMKEAITPNP